MKHWSTDTTELYKDPEAFAVWSLEQAINFGLGGKKIKKFELKQYWNLLDLDPYKKKFLSLIVF